jgi:cytochrome c oxidase assembly factor CtaG/cytochrome c2
MTAFACSAACLAAAPAQAAGPLKTVNLGWSAEPAVLASLALASVPYVAGLLRMRGREGLGRTVGGREVGAFSAGIVALVLALLSPLDRLSHDLFSAHMTQHLLLLLVAAPLLVAGRPAIVFLWAFPRRARRRIGAIWIAAQLGRGIAALMHPVAVWLLFIAGFVFWHMPGPYEWAIASEPVHALEHVSFLLTALMFWTIVIEPSGRRRIGFGATLIFVATTAVVSSLPGALIFLATRPLYAVHASSATAFGLSPLEDQQIAGVIMWIPGGLMYLAAALWVFARWLAEAEKRVSAPRLARTKPPRVALMLALLLVPCSADLAVAQSLPGGTAAGDADRGAALIRDYGCGACHVIPGIAGADGLVGPPLSQMGRRIYLAGLLRNTPDNMALWLQKPQSVLPGNAMPDMGLTTQQARDVAAYLDNLR